MYAEFSLFDLLRPKFDEMCLDIQNYGAQLKDVRHYKLDSLTVEDMFVNHTPVGMNKEKPVYLVDGTPPFYLHVLTITIRISG